MTIHGSTSENFMLFFSNNTSCHSPCCRSSDRRKRSSNLTVASHRFYGNKKRPKNEALIKPLCWGDIYLWDFGEDFLEKILPKFIEIQQFRVSSKNVPIGTQWILVAPRSFNIVPFLSPLLTVFHQRLVVFPSKSTKNNVAFEAKGRSFNQ